MPAGVPEARSLVPAARSFAPEARFLVPPLLSAVLLVLALPPFHVLPLAFVALAPLAVGLALLPPGPGSGSRASFQGGMFGVLFWAYSLVWVPLEVGRDFFWALPAYGLLLTLLGALSALFGWTAHRLYHGVGLPLPLAVPLAWVGVEWIKVNFPLGLAFPWLGLGVTLTPWPWLLGVAEWTGEGGVAFWLAMANGWVAGELIRLMRRPRRNPILSESSGGYRALVTRTLPARTLLALALLAPPLLGWARARTLSLLPGPTVAVVGTDVPRELRADPGASAREALGQIGAALAHSLPFPPPDLILLPEATLPMPLDGEEAEVFLDQVLSLAARIGAPLVVGALGRTPDGRGSYALTNSAYLVLPDRGVSQRYDKARLVPGMEAGKYLPGSGGGTIRAGAWVFGPLVCYESLFGGLARSGRQEGAHALLNLTSDIWFGDGDGLLGALFLRQHPAHLVLRAVENRMPVARAANGGFTFVLDPLGRVSSSVVPPDGGLVVAQLFTTPALTVFTRVGDLVGPACFLLGILVLLLARPGRCSP